jgi:hypothetical protein
MGLVVFVQLNSQGKIGLWFFSGDYCGSRRDTDFAAEARRMIVANLCGLAALREI